MAIHESAEGLRFRRCHNSECNAVFAICRCCDRGQRYCSAVCRQRVRRAQVAAAGQRYQASEAGRQAHCRRQLRYRQRSVQPSVTHQGTRSIPWPRDFAGQSLYRCAVCGRFSRWHNPFDPLPRRRFRPPRVQPRRHVQISTFSRDR